MQDFESLSGVMQVLWSEDAVLPEEGDGVVWRYIHSINVHVVARLG